MAVLIERTNPFGNLVATVEDDGRCVYLYVHHAQFRGWGFRPLWLANRPCEGADAPGQAPRLHAARTDHPDGRDAFGPDDLEVVWTPSGDGVFLLERGQLLAHLPGVDDTLGSPGFSRHAIARDRYAWTFSLADRDLTLQLDEARDYWAEVQRAEVWQGARDRMLEAGANAFGDHSAYWAIDESKWPSLGVAKYTHREHLVFTTVGMSVARMPAPTDAGLDRTEIAFAVSGHGHATDGGWCVQTAGWLGRYPWSWYTPVEDGALIMAPTAHASWFAPDSSAVLLVEDPAAWDAEAMVPFVAPRGVRVLWALFLSADDVKTLEIRGHDVLRQRFLDQRRSVVFSG